MVPEIIMREVLRNLPSDLEKDFFRLIQSSKKIEHHPVVEVPHAIFSKYRQEGRMKQADDLIAARVTDGTYNVFLYT